MHLLHTVQLFTIIICSTSGLYLGPSHWEAGGSHSDRPQAMDNMAHLGTTAPVSGKLHANVLLRVCLPDL